MPRRKVAARPDDCDLSLGSYLAVNDFDSSVRSRAHRSEQLVLLSLDVIARRNVALLARDRKTVSPFGIFVPNATNGPSVCPDRRFIFLEVLR
jgi:hypothetical protein